jgi:hypothetical protein
MKKCKKIPQFLISKKLRPTGFCYSLRNHGALLDAFVLYPELDLAALQEYGA